MKKIELIEFLRGYSILSIIIFHFLQSLHMHSMLGKLISFGGTGVHLFVVLSGFGLYYSYMHKPLSYTSFLQKRISKIYFPYILIVIISALITLLIPIYKGSWYALGGHIFLYKMFDESIMGSYGYPLWFISMIIQFYLVFNPLALLKDKIGDKWFLIVSFAVSLLWIGGVIVLGKETERVWNSFFLRYVWEFSIGMVLAGKYARDNKISSKPIQNNVLLIVGIFCCILYAGLALKGGELGKMTNDIPALIGYSFIAIWIYNLKIKHLNRFLNYTGVISYPLYLLHTLIQMIMLYYLATVNVHFALTIALILVYILSGLFQKSINFVYNKKK